MECDIPSTSATLTPSNVVLLSTSIPPRTSSLLNLPIDVMELIIPLLTDRDDYPNFVVAINSDSRSNIYDDIILRESKKRLNRRKAELLRTEIALEKEKKNLEKMQKTMVFATKLLDKQRRRKRRRL